MIQLGQMIKQTYLLQLRPDTS